MESNCEINYNNGIKGGFTPILLLEYSFLNIMSIDIIYEVRIVYIIWHRFNVVFIVKL